MLSLNIEVEGKTQGDLELALEEVQRLVAEGYLSGANSNDDGSYNFSLTGEEESPDEEDEDSEDEADED